MSDAIETVFSRRDPPEDRELYSRDACGSTTNVSETVFVVDDDYFCREGIAGVLQDYGWRVESFSSCEDFLVAHDPQPNTCLLLDVHFPGMTGLELLELMDANTNRPPVIVVSGSSGIAEAVQSMKRGALDFIEKPVLTDVLVASVKQALGRSRRVSAASASRAAAHGRLSSLTGRQRQVMDMVLAGHPSKNIAADLGISQRTVENHRASIMHRTGARSIAALVQLAIGDGSGPER